MASQSLRNTSSRQSSSAASPSPSSTSSSPISQRASSQTPSPSLSPLSRSPSSSSKIPTTSPTTRPQSISPSFSTINLPSISISQSASSQSQIASQGAIADSQATPLLHKPGVIAAIAASIVAVILFAALVCSIYRRRRIRQMQVESSISAQHPFMQEYPRDADAKGWVPTASPNSTTGSASGSGWPVEEVVAQASTMTPIPLFVDRPPRRSVTSLAGSAKAQHYTVRSHASVADVYGFGQDVAWKEAHYEDPLPVLRPSQPKMSTVLHPDIDVTPPTPQSGNIFHHNNDTAPSATLLRSASTASSVSSVYSTASLEPSVPPAIIVAEEFREDARSEESGQGSGCLI